MLQRRTVLAALGTTLASAGCLADETRTGDGTPTEAADTPAGSPSETSTGGTPDGSDTQVPSDWFDDIECPSITDTDRTVCWQTRSDSGVSLRPSAATFRPVSNNGEIETITFTLSNGSDERFSFNPYEWAVYRQEGDGWTRVAPDEYVEPWEHVPPGGQYQWVLSRQTHPTPGGENTLYPTVAVETGIYAFTVHGLRGEGNSEESVEYVALLGVERVDGSPRETPTPP